MGVFPNRRSLSMIGRVVVTIAIGIILTACDSGGGGGIRSALAPYVRTYEAWLERVQNAYAASRDTRPEAGPVVRSATEPAAHDDPALTRLITEASARFDLPEPWIRATIRVESNGVAGAISPKGAIGLMQVMPDTYAYLSVRHNLGEDPYAPRNNVLAGSAYLREMYDRYSSAGYLAAYNAGPGRYEDYLVGGRALPQETRRYVASVRLALGEVLFSQPDSRFYEPIEISPKGELLLGRTGEAMPVDARLALHSLLVQATQRAATK